jgi:DNA-3-methyladenine glycosylase
MIPTPPPETPSRPLPRAVAEFAPRLDVGLLAPGALEAAPALLGAKLVHILSDGSLLVGRIVETEAYTEDDPASHSYRGPSLRTRSMFGRPGLAYIYKIYGVHFCLNVSAGAEGAGEAVLLRALEPLAGLDRMAAARGGRTTGLCDGPGKLCQAFGLDRTFDGEDLLTSERLFLLAPAAEDRSEEIAVSPRVGIVQAADWPRRFYFRDNVHVSRRPKSAPKPGRQTPPSAAKPCPSDREEGASF